MTRPAIAEPCAFPGDLSLTDGVDVIRYHAGALYINGYHSRVVSPLTLEGLATDVLGVVLDPVPSHLVTPFAEQAIAQLGPLWVMLSTDVEAWIRRHTGQCIHAGTPLRRRGLRVRQVPAGDASQEAIVSDVTRDPIAADIITEIDSARLTWDAWKPEAARLILALFAPLREELAALRQQNGELRDLLDNNVAITTLREQVRALTEERDGFMWRLADANDASNRWQRRAETAERAVSELAVEARAASLRGYWSMTTADTARWLDRLAPAPLPARDTKGVGDPLPIEAPNVRIRPRGRGIDG